MKGINVKDMRKVIILASTFVGLNAFAGYNCHKLNDNGSLGPALVNLSSLEMDSSVLSGLSTPISMEGATFIKYQFWADAGDGFSMVQFIGIKDILGEEGNAILTVKNLFCKWDGAIDEGGQL